MTDYELTGGLEPEVVQRESGLWGYQTPMHETQPDRISTSTSGNGSIGFFGSGCQLDAGGGGGSDLARISSFRPTGFGADDLRLATRIIPVSVNGDVTTGEASHVGWGTSTSLPVGVDFIAGEFQAGAASTAITAPSVGDFIVYILEVDYTNNNSTLTSYGAVEEELTLNDVDDLESDIALVRGTGDGERMRIPWVQEIYQP